jgi:hypothetical protein
LVQQFYLSIGCLLFLIVGRHDVNIDEFLGWLSGGPLTEKIEPRLLHGGSEMRRWCLGIGNSALIQIIIISLFRLSDNATSDEITAVDILWYDCTTTGTYEPTMACVVTPPADKALG